LLALPHINGPTLGLFRTASLRSGGIALAQRLSHHPPMHPQVLTLVKFLHELLERQAIRRVESGSLSDRQTEELGMVLMQQAQEIERLRKEFGLEEADLNLDLGPLGRLL